MSDPRLTRANDNADRRHDPSIPLAHAQPAMSTRPCSNSSHDLVSGPMPTPPRTRRESAKLQLYDRYSQQMLVLACMFVGCVLGRNGAQNRQLTGLSRQCRDLGISDQWLQRSTSDANSAHGRYCRVLVHARGSLPVLDARRLARAPPMGPFPSFFGQAPFDSSSTRYTSNALSCFQADIWPSPASRLSSPSWHLAGLGWNATQAAARPGYS